MLQEGQRIFCGCKIKKYVAQFYFASDCKKILWAMEEFCLNILQFITAQIVIIYRQ